MDGLSLLRTLIESTGLPAEAVERELQRLLVGRNVNELTLDDVREVLARYLQDVLLEAKADLSDQP